MKYKEKNIQQLVPHVMDDSYKSKNISSLVRLQIMKEFFVGVKRRKREAASAKRIQRNPGFELELDKQ